MTKSGCALPDLPTDRLRHTSADGIICGGGQDEATKTSCVDIKDGEWSSEYQDIKPRDGHVAWKRGKNSIFVLGGGRESQNTKTMDIVYNSGKVDGVQNDPSGTPFTLKYPIQ